MQDARVHYAVLKQQPHHHHPHPHTPQRRRTRCFEWLGTTRNNTPPPPRTNAPGMTGLLFQDPTVCQRPPHHPDHYTRSHHHQHPRKEHQRGVLGSAVKAPCRHRTPSNRPPVSQEPTTITGMCFLEYSTHEHHTPGTIVLAGGFYTQPPPQPQRGRSQSMQTSVVVSFAP